MSDETIEQKKAELVEAGYRVYKRDEGCDCVAGVNTEDGWGFSLWEDGGDTVESQKKTRSFVLEAVVRAAYAHLQDKRKLEDLGRYVFEVAECEGFYEPIPYTTTDDAGELVERFDITAPESKSE